MQNFFGVWALIWFTVSAQAGIQSDLEALRVHPDLVPAKTGRARETFDATTIADRSFLTRKDNFRKKLCTLRNGKQVCLKDVLPGRAAIGANDRVEDLIGYSKHLLRNLSRIEKKNLRSASLTKAPWSDTYWPLYRGAIADRYADPKYPAAKEWEKNSAYVHAPGQSLADYFALALSAPSAELHAAIDLLSPAEKYDLLIGDTEGSLTHANWAGGQGYFEETGKVEDWMGLCNGWAPASFSLPRPERAVTTVAADGRTPLTFYPSDLKALGTLLWANADVNYNFLGARCNAKHPRSNEEGRILNQDCFDTNPAAWHMGVVNQLGLFQRGLVIDATYDYEVWNQPVSRYSYTYFNPRTREPADTLAEASVELEDFAEDKFARFRSKDAVTIVGIAMDLTYMEEVDPSHSTANAPSDDNERTVRYYYDLELDENEMIIGGEWYQKLHPDFVWAPPAGTRAMSSGDRTLRQTWDVATPVPLEWQPVANFVSKSAGSPLGHVVESLFNESAKPRDVHP